MGEEPYPLIALTPPSTPSAILEELAKFPEVMRREIHLIAFVLANPTTHYLTYDFFIDNCNKAILSWRSSQVQVQATETISTITPSPSSSSTIKIEEVKAKITSADAVKMALEKKKEKEKK